jgi:hypothetical protein
MKKKKHRSLTPHEKALMAASFGATLKRSEPMWHNVQLEAVVNSHEFGPSPMTGGQPGPLMTQKIVKFTGTGNSLDVASEEAHKQLTAFLMSDGVRIGSDKDSAPTSIVSPILQPFGNTGKPQ